MKRIDGNVAWRGAEIAARDDWDYVLSGHEVAEIEAALKSSASLEMERITAEDFPLPSLTARLEAIQTSLEHGSGSFLLRGWPTAEHDLETNRRVFWGLSHHLGLAISQSASGEKIFHVQDSGFKMGHPKARGPNTSRGLSFHCDRCDVIGFMCIHQAKTGGESYLVSSASVHNEILERRPDLLELLYQPWYYKTHNVDTANDDPWCHQPIFAIEQGRFVGYILRVLIDRAYELPELPDMSEQQRQALDLVESLCADPALHYCFRQQPGDMFFVNNFVNFHSRSEFEDHDDPAKKRLLLRIWLSMPNSRGLPASYSGSFGRTAAGAVRGGIHPPKA